MAPWPEQGNEPKAPDKSCGKGVESNPSDSCKADSGTQENFEAKSAPEKTDEKQDDKNSGVSKLDDGQLKALLDEAITYKRPKDREGKSDLFKELLEEVEAESDGGEESNPPPFGIVDHCRGGKRRRRDAAVSERPTRGGSLQNIVQAYSDFESVYLGGRGKKSFVGGRKKGDFYHYGLGPGSSGGSACARGGGGSSSGGSSSGGSVSARQREGGSLPCNVNAGGGGVCGSGVGGLLPGPASVYPFDGVAPRRRSEQRVSWDEDVMPARMDRGGGGPVAAPPPADVVTVRSEAGTDLGAQVERIDEPRQEGALVAVVVPGGEGVPNGLADGPSRHNGNAEIARTERAVDVPASLELRAQCCVNLLSSSVDDGTRDGVELLELHVSEDNREGESKQKGEGCRRGTAPEMSRFSSESSSMNAAPSVPAASSGAASSSACDRKVRRDAMRQESVDTVVPFSLQSDEKKSPLVGGSGNMNLDLTKGLVNGMETGPLQLQPSYASVKSLVGSSTSPLSSTSESMATLTTSSSASAHENNASHVGLLEERIGVSATVKEMNTRKQHLGETQTKPVMPIQGQYSMYPPMLNYPPNNWMSPSEGVSRINFQGGKDLSDVKCKSLDENGNAVTISQGLNKDVHEKGKPKHRKPKLNNDCKIILSQNIEGFRGDQDLDCLLKFIGMDEEKKSKNTNNGTVERVRRGNLRRESDRGSMSNDVGSGRVRAARERNGASEDKDDVSVCGSSNSSGGEKGSSSSKVGRAGTGGRQHQHQVQRGGKMKKSNSLEEISKTKSEDLTLSGPKKEDELNSHLIAANASLVDNVAKQGKEVAKNICGGSYKHDSLDNSAKDDIIVDQDDKPFKGDHNGNSELGSKSSSAVDSSKGFSPATSFKEDFYAVTDASPQILEETEFHVVTKKQRRKKRRTVAGDSVSIEGRSHGSRDSYSYSGVGSGNDRSEGFKNVGERSDTGRDLSVDGEEKVWESSSGGDGRFLGSYRRHHRRHRSQRSGDRLKSTSSVPPSEHSEESSDDSDSVHSLPVSSSVPRPPADPSSTSSGSTPQASYADIARMAFSSTIPVMSGSPSNPNPSNLLLPSTSAQKVKPVITESLGQTSFSSVSSSTSPGTASIPYIGSTKVNIGAPPVSGSKASSPSVPSGETSVPSGGCHVPKSEPQVIVSDDTDVKLETDGSVHSLQNSNVTPNTTSEPRKKDAMTCTTLDGKPVASTYPFTGVHSPQQKPEPENPVHNVGPNTPNILEDYYPSLQESLHEKTERRNGKLGQHQTVLNKISPGDEKRILKCAAPSPPAPIITTCESKPAEAEALVSASVVPSMSSEKTLVPSVNEKASASLIVKTKEPTVTATRIKGSGKKPGFRSLPPVVIMDHHYRQDSASKEGGAVGISNEVGESGFNSTDIGGFTFGFEVNEELLALSGADSLTGQRNCSAAEVNKKVNCNPILPPPMGDKEESAPLPSLALPVTSTEAIPGKEPIPKFRTPEVDTNRFNYEKIVSFIGSSWEDIMKEMNVPVKHTGGRVQYYDGQ